MVICCGDFGYWPRLPTSYGVEPLKNLRNGKVKVLWCDGNHEDHWSLAQRESDEVAPNVFYMPRGSTYDLSDGRKVLFMGGAHSIDKDSRMIGVDWFPEETITQRDLHNLPPDDTKIDILVSHTCSLEVLKAILGTDPRKGSDPSLNMLSLVTGIFKPDLWYFGHWHEWKRGKTENGCRWTALSMPGKTGWWEWLPKGNCK